MKIFNTMGPVVAAAAARSRTSSNPAPNDHKREESCAKGSDGECDQVKKKAVPKVDLVRKELQAQLSYQCGTGGVWVANKTAREGDPKLEELNAMALKEIKAQLYGNDGPGKVWVKDWRSRFLTELGTLREFLEARSDNFEIHPGSGDCFTVSLKNFGKGEGHGHVARPPMRQKQQMTLRGVKVKSRGRPTESADDNAKMEVNGQRAHFVRVGYEGGAGAQDGSDCDSDVDLATFAANVRPSWADHPEELRLPGESNEACANRLVEIFRERFRA